METQTSSGRILSYRIDVYNAHGAHIFGGRGADSAAPSGRRKMLRGADFIYESLWAH